MTPTRAPFQHSTRCVHCGYQRDRHTVNPAGLEICVGSSGNAGKSFGSMNLPPGKTCDDCVHIPRCQAMFGHIPEDLRCDWFPIRFQERGQ
jgi:hypothetical protein